MAHADSSSSVLTSSFRRVVLIVVILVLVGSVSGVLLTKFFSSSSTISNGPANSGGSTLSNEPFRDFRTIERDGWFETSSQNQSDVRLQETSQKQSGESVNRQVEIFDNQVTDRQVNVQVAVGFGAYWDGSCNATVRSIDWGTISPGSFKNMTIFLRNEGNAPSSLSIGASNWNPVEASNFLSLGWDYNNYVVYPQQTIKVILTLSAASVVEGLTDFSFDVIITANS